MAILMLAIGFATVSTVLYINGTTEITANTEDYQIYFTSSKTDIGGSSEILADKQHINWTTKTLSKVGDTATLDYTVKNESTLYDATAYINLTNPNSEYFDIVLAPTSMDINSGDIESGTITVTLKKLLQEEFDDDQILKVELVVNAKERESARIKDNVTLVTSSNRNSSFTGLLNNSQA